MPKDKTEFRVLSELLGGATGVVAVSGELDIATASALRDALTEATDRGIRRLVVDLSRATFVDSVGIGAIVRAKRDLGAAGRVAIVVPSQSYAGVIFDVVGARTIVDVYETRAAALAHVTA